MDKCYKLSFFMMCFVLLEYLSKSLSHKFSTSSGLPQWKCNVCIIFLWKKVMVIRNIYGVQISETKLWDSAFINIIRYVRPWVCRTPLKLNLFERIQVLLSTQFFLFYGIRLYNSGYLETKLYFFLNNSLSHGSKHWED